MAYEYKKYDRAWEWLKIMLRQEIEWEFPLEEGTPNKYINDAYKVVFNRMRGLEEEYNLDLLNDSNQIQEAYRKAKAWDKYIADVRERVKITVNTDDGVEKETQEVINYYMGDE